MLKNYLKRGLAILLALTTQLAFSQKILPKKQNETPKSVEQKSVMDQVIADDLIVQGSACIGLDCVNNENFGFSTIRLKENNLRIEFDDTSASAGFANTDWVLEANESASGGANAFSIVDNTNAKTPFRIEANTPNNTLYVDNGGRIGIGTATPATGIHHATGNSPTMRFEQDASSGFTAQTWDMAGNEANFFIRDVTNGSKLPFRIRPGAPTSTIDIAADGDIGLGTSSPQARLHIKGTATTAADLLLEGDNPVISMIGGDGTNTWLFDAKEDTLKIKLNGNTKLTLNESGLVGDIDLSSVTDLTIGGDFTMGNNWNLEAGVGNFQIREGTDAKISIIGDNAYIKGAILPEASLPSDRRLKNQISNFSNARSTIDLLSPKTFCYDLTKFPDYGFPKGTQYGLIAQEVEKVLPDYVNEVSFPDGKRFKTVNYIGLIPILLQSNKEQQAEIERLKAKISNYAALESRLTALEAKLEDSNDVLPKIAEKR